ncbi:glycosyltransferase family 2 protein [Dictyobacter kobayashii]|uniref:Glycosyl transferase n=1 Tax=Dictyobacter kobayashii TaxID=2014872 RepID=A0A402ACB9_9CHLR|nr:glycosyltransferase family 2 protein [Dictyobacter kobayashii]GCE16728.1 glycosyl transferase [Dictyobacter kobayashii]
MIDISIIIVSWNVAELLRSCLLSIHRSPVYIVQPDKDVPTEINQLSVEIIVVDSHSNDNTLEMLHEFSNVLVIAQKENLGFAKCNNIGLQIARGRYLFLLNPDTELVGNVLNTLIAYLDQHSNVGIAGPHLTDAAGKLQKVPRRFPKFIITLFDTPSLQAHLPRWLLSRYAIINPIKDACTPVEWVLGAALIIRQETFQDIGPLDEKYPMYSEEIDWCMRATQHGWSIECVGIGQVVHHGGKSSEQIPLVRHTYYWQSTLRFFQKYYKQYAILLRFCVILSYLHVLCFEFGHVLMSKNSKKKNDARMKIKIYRKALVALITHPYKLVV